MTDNYELSSYIITVDLHPSKALDWTLITCSCIGFNAWEIFFFIRSFVLSTNDVRSDSSLQLLSWRIF